MLASIKKFRLRRYKMNSKWRWYELLLPDLRKSAKGVQKMETLGEYHKLILISMAIVVFLPLTTLMAEDEWEWYNRINA
jgi:hypothetical protein